VALSLNEVEFRITAAANASANAKPSVCFVGLANLCVLAPEYASRGAAGEQVQHTLIAKALARRGYRVSMVTADYGQPDGAAWDGVVTYKAFAPSAGLPLLRFIHPRWTGLWAALKRANADVYYTSCAGGLVGQVAMFCRAQRRGFIYRVASDADCDRRRTLVKSSIYLREQKMYEYGLRRADVILAQTEHQRHLLRANYGANSELARMIVEFGNAQVPFEERHIEALWVSNLRPLKRPDILFDLASRLAALRFHMAGGVVPGLESYFEEIKHEAARLPNLTFHGSKPYGEVGRLYEGARVFVNTSDTEGFPNTYLQAWASGTPVVAFFDPDGLIAREGLGAAVHSTEEMVEAVKRLTSDPVHWAAVSARCRAFVEREFGDDIVLQPYRDSIARAVPDKRRARMDEGTSA
jgi:glycosyltransferase involved in cell wall biosynthesis